MKKQITFITGNENKAREAQEILHPIKVKISDIGYPEIQDKIENVATNGAENAFKRLKKPLIVEDSGLFIDAYNGFPGPYSSYVHQTIKNKGILELMKNQKNRDCHFKSIVAYIDKDTTKIFKGKVVGKIAHQQKGKHGFGYDPIFIPKNKNKTFGQMDMEAKNQLSHRRKALKKLDHWLKKQ
ncbi:XTP/dITP diphosphatase [Methanonatronarchaeum sp. AMET-Sl]|uniref:XTP/dITP diphosphatase n=1 Tax=Methanonatronarchaeum sp. AMET-Sl TaxID=3037654 RepID=UPI00244E0366|nr:XTP/dITP diphosphatase [Methanonatronarchaeum sp. AMET-Sl]WGI16984.1 XTP/dITP diphosphatase [Methanonatronarchaeum sp. AMET-Sl]